MIAARVSILGILLLPFLAADCIADEVPEDRGKTDIVWLKNGDRLTGEIKELEQGKLRLSTNAMGEVRIEWDDIARIDSRFEFQFEEMDGRRVSGTVVHAQDEVSILPGDGGDSVVITDWELVRITQIEDTFWDALNGSLTVGYSFTKASDVAQANLSGRATHRTEIRAWTLEGSTILTEQEGDSTSRSSAQLRMARFRANRWFNAYNFGLESNDELGLKLRTSLGASLGRFLTQSNKAELSVQAGAVATAETFDGDAESEQNLEGMIGLDYSRYVYDSPTIDLTTRLMAFPSITDAGRVRSQLDISLRWEIISDFFWDLTFYDTYDSDPPSGSESNNDYGIVTSLGWSF